MEDDRGVVFKAEGPNGWSIVGAGAFIGIALVIIALALFSISQYVGVAVIVAAAGQFVLASCTGAARIIEARGRARAMIGPNTREDIKALWGEDHGA
jgi:hypothetical protein